MVAIEEPPRGRLPVSSAALVCPDPSALGPGSTTDVTFAAPRIAGTTSVAGRHRRGGRARPGRRAPAARWTTAGRWGASRSSRPTPRRCVVRTLGSLAPGLAATQVTRSTEGDAQGLAATTCTEAGTSAWFVGVGTEIGHRPRLYLVNPEQTPAELDVVLFGPAGPVDAPAARNLVVPGARRR